MSKPLQENNTGQEFKRCPYDTVGTPHWDFRDCALGMMRIFLYRERKYIEKKNDRKQTCPH